MARKARVEFFLSVIELLFLSLTVEALEGKNVSKLATIRSGEVTWSQNFWGKGSFLRNIFLVSTKLDTFCYPRVQTAPCYVLSF